MPLKTGFSAAWYKYKFNFRLTFGLVNAINTSFKVKKILWEEFLTLNKYYLVFYTKFEFDLFLYFISL